MVGVPYGDAVAVVLSGDSSFVTRHLSSVSSSVGPAINVSSPLSSDWFVVLSFPAVSGVLAVFPLQLKRKTLTALETYQAVTLAIL